MKRNTVDKVRENLRLQQVYNILMRYSADALFGRSGLAGVFRHRMQRWVWQLPKNIEPPSAPVKMRLMLEELGPTYVKMGQIVSSQSSVIPEDWDAELEKLQSNVPPFPSTEVREIIIEELGEPPEELYASFQSEPFAAASTAQVHHAVLHDGQHIVVKVQRPGIQNQMKADLGIMLNAARVASRRVEYLESIDLVGMLEQFSTAVLNELDYTGEAYNALRLADNMSTIPGVHIPVILMEYSTSRILTMEYIKGVKISDMAAIDEAGLDRSVLSQNALRSLVKQLLIDGFFHADPHPGNILLNLETGVINFIDTGMVGELELHQRLNLIQLLFALARQEVGEMAHIIRSLSTPFVDVVDEKAYYRDFNRKMGRLMYRESSFGDSVGVMFGLLRENGLRLDPQLTLAIKALMQVEAVAAALDPESSFTKNGVNIVQELAAQEITTERLVEEGQKQVLAVGREIFQRLPTLQEATGKWFDQYEKGRFEVSIDTSELSREVDKIRIFGRQAIIGVMLVGMVIGSAIAISILAFIGPTGEYWDLIEYVAYFGYVISMVLAALIVIRLLWNWIRDSNT